MARDAITPVQITQAGATASARVTGVNANELKIVGPIPDDRIMWLEIENLGAGSLDVTIKTNKTYEGLTVPARTVTVAAGATKVAKLMPLALYVQANTDIEIDITADTDLKFRAYYL